VNGTVLMYADAVTGSMRKAIDETNRRRAAQAAYNEAHGITPQTIRKAIGDPLVVACEGDYVTVPVDGAALAADAPVDPALLAKRIAALRGEMREAARQLEFERAASLRDEIRTLEERLLGVAVPEAEPA
jgi:excinuclease ABC subunit B